MCVGISQSSSGDPEHICISLVVAVVDLYSLDKKEMGSLVLISVLQTMYTHILNKHLKSKDSQRSKQPKDLAIQYFSFCGLGQDIKTHKDIKSLILSIVSMKIY